MNPAYIFALSLLVLAIVLILAVYKEWIPPGMLKILIEICAILSLIATVAIFFIAAASPPDPFTITIHNQLKQPVTIVIDGKDEADLPAERIKTYRISSFPVEVAWTVINVQTTTGNVLGDYMGGRFPVADNSEPIIIDNIVKANTYFYPVVTNNTNKNCSLIIDYALVTAKSGNAIVKPHTTSPLGYYQLHDRSNIFFTCDDKTYYWSYKPSPVLTRTGDERLKEEIISSSGFLQLVINE